MSRKPARLPRCRTLATVNQKRGAAWLLGVTALLALAVMRWPAQNWLAVDFQALLPSSHANPWIEQASREAASLYERQVLWMLEGDDAEVVRAHLALIESRLSASGFIDTRFESEQASRWAALSRALYPYRRGLLAREDRALLQSDPQRYFERFVSLLYSPLGGQALAALPTDPAGLYTSFLQQVAPANALQLVANTPAGLHSELLLTSIDPQQLGFDAVAGLYTLFRSLRADAEAAGLQLHATGVPLYSAYGVHSAKREMSTIGIASALLLVGLLLWALRSGRAVVLTLLCVTSGVAAGFVLTVIMLQQIHILALVFGATLIGIAADYALHYFVHSLLPGWTPQASLHKVFRGLLFGMLSSVVAFSALTLIPFPGIRQIGLFMAAGLLFSFVTVCLLFPVLFRRAESARGLPAFTRARRWTAHRAAIPLLVTVAVALLLLSRVPGTEDVRAFYAAPEALSESEKVMSQRLPAAADSRYLLLQAGREDALRTVEEQLAGDLAALRETGALQDYFALTQLVPSQATQQDNFALLQRVSARGYIAAHMQRIGLGERAVEDFQASLTAPFEPASFAVLEALPLPLGIGGFLGCREGECASWVRLAGIVDEPALLALVGRYDNVALVDPVDEINRGINTYRTAVATMLLCAVLVTLGFLSIAAGFVRALRILLLPVVSCTFTLVAIVVFKGSFSIINLMALLLVLGVSLDYAIFRAFTKEGEQPATTLAITLSALTSILAFGMLAFSNTPVISHFGQTIALGLLLAYGLSWVNFGAESGR